MGLGVPPESMKHDAWSLYIDCRWEYKRVMKHSGATSNYTWSRVPTTRAWNKIGLVKVQFVNKMGTELTNERGTSIPTSRFCIEPRSVPKTRASENHRDRGWYSDKSWDKYQINWRQQKLQCLGMSAKRRLQQNSGWLTSRGNNIEGVQTTKI